MERKDYLKGANAYLTEEEFDPQEARQAAKAILTTALLEAASTPDTIADRIGVDTKNEYFYAKVMEDLQDIAGMTVKNIDRMP